MARGRWLWVSPDHQFSAAKSAMRRKATVGDRRRLLVCPDGAQGIVGDVLNPGRHPLARFAWAGLLAHRWCAEILISQGSGAFSLKECQAYQSALSCSDTQRPAR